VPFLTHLGSGLTGELVEINVTELADYGRRVLPRTLVIVGSGEHRRIALFPARSTDAGSLDAPIQVAGAARASVGAAIVSLLSPPFVARVTPSRAADTTLSQWRAALDADAAADVVSSEWRSTLPAGLASLGTGDPESGVVRALAAPVATVELLRHHSGRDATSHLVIALARDCAVEWTIDGSFVRWRPLDAPGVREVIGEVFAFVGRLRSENHEHDLTVRQVARLLDAATDAHVDIPPALAHLAADAGTAWWSIASTAATKTTTLHTSLLVAVGPSRDAWSIRPSSLGFTAIPRSGSELIDEVLDLLLRRTASPRGSE
jgi:hypothetical protein